MPNLDELEIAEILAHDERAMHERFRKALGRDGAERFDRHEREYAALRDAVQTAFASSEPDTMFQLAVAEVTKNFVRVAHDALVWRRLRVEHANRDAPPVYVRLKGAW
jgi:hypothetical protein